MAESNFDNNTDAASPASPASSPDELVKDLEIKLSEEAADSVVGGRKAGKGQQEFLIVKMNDVIITS